MSSVSQFGLLSTGFVPKSLQESRSDIQAQMQALLGNVDLSDSSVLSQIAGITANADADLWAALGALYASQTLQGASGAALDNILALNGLTRLGAAATVTDPSPVTDPSGIVRYGLTLQGTPGTLVKAGALVSTGSVTPVTFALDADVTIAAANNAQQKVFFSNQPTSGAYTLTLTAPSGATATTSSLPYNTQAMVTTYGWATPPPTGTYVLQLGTLATAAIAATATATAVQSAIQALQGYAGVTVSGSPAAGFSLIWPAGYVPLVSATGSAAPTQLVQALTAQLQAITTGTGIAPFTDVLAADGTQQVTISFGAIPPQTGQPSTAATPIARVSALTPTLARGAQSTNVSVQTVVVGSVAQGIGTATATNTGPQAVKAGQINTIATPVSGLSSVTNGLDCLTGRDTESDTQAVARLQAKQGSSASGSLGAIINRVSAVSGVTQCVGFQNTSSAAQQLVVFASAPGSGQFSLLLGDQTTPLQPYNVSASALQAAVRNLAGFGTVSVTSYGTGFAFDFAGVRGGQALAPIGVPQNTTGVTLAQFYGRPPHSVEIVAEGGSTSDIAQAILGAIPAGISTYSNPALRTTGSITQGTYTLTVATALGVQVGQNVEGTGIPLGTSVASVAQNVITLSAPATATQSSTAIAFDYAPLLTDVAGNPLTVGFSRPISTIIYVDLQIVSDRFLTPGDQTSGINASSQFDVGSVAAIQQGLADIINAVPIGGTIVANGTNSLGGSFRSIAGVVSYDLFFDRTPSPTNTKNLSLQTNEAPLAESYSISVSVR